METLAYALLIWFLVGGLFAGFVEHVVLSYSRSHKKYRKAMCPVIGILTSLIRLILILWLCVRLLDCTLSDHCIKILIFADVLSTAIHAYLVVHRYGFYARLSGFRTGCNVGSLAFGTVYLLSMFF
ncbi:MAG: hypothetical protein IJU76_11290 [Desulfovibrionaceae bacterium]|nr:hypothetical protein [Desulfovibrionaceae bacterium]